MIAERSSAYSSTLPGGKNLRIGKFELTPTAIVPIGRPTYEEWDALGAFLQVVDGAIQWWIGDWLAYGEANYQERAQQAVAMTGREPETINQYRWVAERVPPARRDPDLSWQHHREVAALEPQEQREWLARAKDGDDGARWSGDRLRREINTVKRPQKPVYWLLVQCTDPDDRERTKQRLEREGRIVKLPDERSA